MTSNLKSALRARIAASDWMSARAKAEAIR
jgi:predicted metalloendopeptidase